MPRAKKKPQHIKVENLNQNSSNQKEEFSFDLDHQLSENKEDKKTDHIHSNTPISTSAHKFSNHFMRKIWYIAEWLAVSAAIFSILFLIINFQSYSDLFKSKINQLTGQTQSQIQVSEMKNVAPENQRPLPIIQNPESAKKQVPALSLSIISPDYRIAIPRIRKNVPIVNIPINKLLQRDFAGLDKQIQAALQNGVLHFPGTAEPGENGNVVITGHSSYFPWDPGRFKDVFALLHQVEIGDEIIVYKNQKAYKYIVYDKFVVHPDQINVLTQKGANKLTLITCTPVGTALNRLIVVARPEK